MGRYNYKAPPDTTPWERQDGESPQAWAAFQAFRDLGQDRTLRAAAEKIGRSRSTLTRYSMEFTWVDRAAAWDREQDRQAQKAQLAEIKKMRKTHADLGSAMLVKAAKALKRIPDDEIKAGDISRMVEVGSKLERIARGDVGEVIEEREGESLPVVTFYIPDNGRDSVDETE